MLYQKSSSILTNLVGMWEINVIEPGMRLIGARQWRNWPCRLTKRACKSQPTGCLVHGSLMQHSQSNRKAYIKLLLSVWLLRWPSSSLCFQGEMTSGCPKHLQEKQMKETSSSEWFRSKCKKIGLFKCSLNSNDLHWWYLYSQWVSDHSNIWWYKCMLAYLDLNQDLQIRASKSNIANCAKHPPCFICCSQIWSNFFSCQRGRFSMSCS